MAPPRHNHEHELANAAEWRLDLPQAPPKPSANRPPPRRPPAPILDEMPKLGATERSTHSKRIAPPQTPHRSTYRPKPSESSSMVPLRPPPQRRPKEDLFPKVRPRDVREEQRAEDRAKKEAQQKQFTLPLPPVDLPFSLVFLWPEGPIGLDTLDRDSSRTVLDDIRQRHHCFIEIDSANNAIVCNAMTEREVFLLQNRFEGLYREIISKWDNTNTINVINGPGYSVYKDQVDLQPVSDSAADGRLPVLVGKRPEETLKKTLDQEAIESRKANERLMCKAIEVQLQGLRLTKHHVRMRLNIGVMALKRYHRPSDGALHTVEEFEEMMGEELTSLAMRRIAVGCCSKDKLKTACLESGLFSNPEEILSANFNFVDNDKKVLRLEREYILDQFGDAELGSRRWLEIAGQGKQLNPLEMNVLDFARYDTQLLITAADFSTNPAIQKQLSSFQNSIEFRSKLESPESSIPEQRSRYTISANNAPNEIEETSTTTFSITGTNLKFAITRHNTFWPRKSGPAAPAPMSEWSFSIYDPAWDVMLGELSNLEAGQDVSWSRTLETFFPGEDGTGGVAGFKAFARWVEIVQDFLAGVLEGAGKVVPKNDERVNGVVGALKGKGSEGEG